jgi:hypothetical protein
MSVVLVGGQPYVSTAALGLQNALAAGFGARLTVGAVYVDDIVVRTSHGIAGAD